MQSEVKQDLAPYGALGMARDCTSNMSHAMVNGVPSGILVAAHDLKAPLCLVRQLALALELAEDGAARARIESQIVSVSERALKQINDLAKFAKLEDGLFTLEPVSVRGVCDEVYQDLAPLFGRDNRKIILRYHNRQRLAVANRDLLSSIVRNFCTNALRYSHTGTISRLEVSDFGEYIRIGVRDYGPSLPTKIWQKLRTGGLDQPTEVAMRPGSSGLGLYFSSQFARYMRADLGAIRHRDGTSFFIDLPISQQATLF